MNQFEALPEPDEQLPRSLSSTLKRPVLLHLPVDLYGDTVQVFEREVLLPLAFVPNQGDFIMGGFDLPGPIVIYWRGYDASKDREIVVLTPGVSSRDTTASEWLRQHPYWRVAVNPPLRPASISEHRRNVDESSDNTPGPDHDPTS